MRFRSATCLLSFLCLLACDQNQDKDAKSTDAVASDAIATAESELADKSYEDVRGTDDCTDDCSGHNAGWEWARDNNVAPDDCSGNSDSFIEGCKAYGEELQKKTSEIEDGQDNQN